MYNKPVRFDGDIIITDPCYITKDRDRSSEPQFQDFLRRDYDTKNMTRQQLIESGYIEDYDRYHEAYLAWDEENPDDWVVCDYGDNMEALGFTTYLCDDTLYGDWSCTTYNDDTKEPIGEFCADAGRVAVFLLDEVLKYNPDFDYHINRQWTTTLIKDFHGEVMLQKTSFKDEDGDDWDEVRVIGTGNINFVGLQTGF